MNTDIARRIEALERLATHAGTPEHEASSARSKALELRIRYGMGTPASRGTPTENYLAGAYPFYSLAGIYTFYSPDGRTAIVSVNTAKALCCYRDLWGKLVDESFRDMNACVTELSMMGFRMSKILYNMGMPREEVD